MERYAKTGGTRKDEEAMNYSSFVTERAQTSQTTLEPLLKAESADLCVDVHMGD